MNETRKSIIELIEPFMDKTLSEGCIIKYKYSESTRWKYSTIFYKDKDSLGYTINRFDSKIHPFDTIRYVNFNEINLNCREYDDGLSYKFINHKILGHYDITAVLKYIETYGEKNIIFREGDEQLDIPSSSFPICNVTYRNRGFFITYRIDLVNSIGIETYSIPNKPLHLYTEQENKNLLELLLKIK